MRVICGTDFSAASGDAATIAALWARRSAGELHLIHAAAGSEAPVGSGPRREALLAEATRLQSLGATVAAVDLVIGDPWEVLVEEAGLRGGDLLVVGAVGAAGAWRAGTVADRIARDSPVPVLVVRNPEPLRRWLLGDDALKVLTGFEPGPSTRRALRWVGQLSQLGQVTSTVIHLVLPGPENRLSGEALPGAGLVLGEETERRLTGELQLAVHETMGEAKVRLKVQSTLGRKDVPLVLEAETSGADLLVVGSHQRRGFRRWWHGSVSSGVLHAAQVSVAVIPCGPSGEPD